MEELEKQLASAPPEQWVTRQVIAFDWHDGPREGVCALAKPAVEFRFTLVAERCNPDGLDDRFFRLHRLPAGSVNRILDVLKAELSSPAHAVWVPLWKFSSAEARHHAEQSLKEIESKAQPTSVIIWSRDMEEFKGWWSVDPRTPDNTDYSSILGLKWPLPR